MKLTVTLAATTAVLAFAACGKPNTSIRRMETPTLIGGGTGATFESDAELLPSSPTATIHIHRPNETYRLPSPKWSEEMDNDQMLGSWEDWSSSFVAALFGKEAQGTWTTDVRAFVEFFNAPEMEWFIDTPNVKSYDQQMAIRRRFLDARANHVLSTGGVARIPKWDELGATAVVPEQSERWIEPIPETWTKCQWPKPYPEDILRNGLGVPEIRVGIKRDLVFHVNRDGKIDSFRIVPRGFIRYTVKKPAKCWLVPGGNDETVDDFIPFKPGMSAPSAGQYTTCPSTDPLAGVIVAGKPCFLDYANVIQAPKQDNRPPKDWAGYSPTVVLAEQPPL